MAEPLYIVVYEEFHGADLQYLTRGSRWDERAGAAVLTAEEILKRDDFITETLDGRHYQNGVVRCFKIETEVSVQELMLQQLEAQQQQLSSRIKTLETQIVKSRTESSKTKAKRSRS